MARINPLYDEAIRMEADTGSIWSGIRASVTLPKKDHFASPNKWSYFNFYLGFEAGKTRIEAGVSFSEDNPKYDAQGWHSFINVDGAKVSGDGRAGVLTSLPLGGVFWMTLALTGANIELRSDFFSWSHPFKGATGTPKMCIALSDPTVKNKRTYFDSAAIECLELTDAKKNPVPIAQSKTKFVYTNVAQSVSRMNPTATPFRIQASMTDPAPPPPPPTSTPTP